MIVRSHDYVEYCRETATNLETLHDLALRGAGKQETTIAVNQHIVEEVALRASDDLIDIGCGDGTLLRLAAKVGVRNAIGYLATEEEATLVRATGLDVRQAYSDRLPAPDASASVVVCNNVLLIVPREKVLPSLREMHRVAVNAWIQESGVFDGVADFDAALRNPEIPTQMRAVDDCGDGLHPSDGGYRKMGDAIELALFA